MARRIGEKVATRSGSGNESGTPHKNIQEESTHKAIFWTQTKANVF